MSDIVERLNRAGDLAIPGEPCGIYYDAANEIERLRLTDAEREAIQAATRIIDAYDEEMDGFPSGAAATLRGLLARLA